MSRTLSDLSKPRSTLMGQMILCIAIATIVAASLDGCSSKEIPVPVTSQSIAATPNFSVASGSYNSTQSVVISDTTLGAMVFYTINGSTPTASSTLYSGAIAVASTETVNAIAIASGYENSAVGSADYTITISPNAGEWTWMSGSQQGFASGTYGSIGVPAANNTPGQRTETSTWTDTSGNLWLFAGEYGFNDPSGKYGFLNDLWEYSLSADLWTWQGGSAGSNAPGQYGTLGMPSPANIPGGRRGAVTWTDSTGKFWLFGGFGYDRNDALSLLGDLWVFDPSTKNWTWMGGSSVGNTSGTFGTQGVGSTANIPASRFDTVSWADSQGNLWLFGGFGITASSQGALNDLWKYSITTGQWTWVNGSQGAKAIGNYGTKGIAAATNQPGSILQGAVGWIDSSGALWLFGGTGLGSNSPNLGGLNTLWRFQPATGLWTWMNGMSTVEAPGIYGARGVASDSNQPGAREYPTAWKSASGILLLFGGVGIDSVGANDILADLWQFNPVSNQWTWIGGSDTVDEPPSFGLVGTASNSNTPGARLYAAPWSDPDGRLWLFGGQGYVSSQDYPDRNDLWVYQP